MLQGLIRSLSDAGKGTRIHSCPDGTRLLLLPYGARVLGLYPPGSEENFYWTNRALQKGASATALFEQDGWHNTGGDRTWLTPELDIFFPDYPRTQQHWEPPQLDASEYQLVDVEQGVRMTQSMTLHFARPGRDIELELSKWLGPAANPLRYERDMAEILSSVAYAGYTQRTTLSLQGTSAADPVEVGLWNLIQLPHGGDLLIPTYSRTKPRILFGEIPADALICEDHLVRFRMRLAGEQKIAVRAAAVNGRVGYLFSSGDQSSLVVRNFFVDPSGQYVDVPGDEPADLGYAVHAVNVNSDLGDFCELEYHAPAIGQDVDRVRGEDLSRVWAFRGTREKIAVLTHRLLGVSG